MPSTSLTPLRPTGPELPSRRTLLRIVATGVLLTMFPAFAGDTSARKHNKRRTRRKKKTAVKITATCTSAEAIGTSTRAPGRMAQTFTATAGGKVIRAELLLEKEAGSLGDYILHLGRVDNFGVPTNEVLAVGIVANPSVPAGISNVTFSFPSPATITAGAQFALVLNRTGKDVIIWHAILNDRCGGQAFTSADQTAPFTTFGVGLDFAYTVSVQ